MRPWRLLCVLLIATPAMADDLFLQASGAQSTVDSQRYSVTRTFNGSGPGVEVGLSRFNGEGAGWTLARFGINGRLTDNIVIRGSIDAGPGRIDGERISYRKAVFGTTWIATPAWSVDLSDTYINVDDSIGHVLGISVSRVLAKRLSVTVDAMRSAGGNLDTEQLGLKFRWQGRISYLGGFYAGETRNPVLLNEFGTEFGINAARLRQAYAGLELPVGDYSLLTLFDYLTLDDTIRREVTFVVRIPFGNDPGNGG